LSCFSLELYADSEYRDLSNQNRLEIGLKNVYKMASMTCPIPWKATSNNKKNRQ